MWYFSTYLGPMNKLLGCIIVHSEDFQKGIRFAEEILKWKTWHFFIVKTLGLFHTILFACLLNRGKANFCLIFQSISIFISAGSFLSSLICSSIRTSSYLWNGTDTIMVWDGWTKVAYQKVNVLEWQSPDLNLTEMLWKDLKWAIFMRKPTNI